MGAAFRPRMLLALPLAVVLAGAVFIGWNVDDTLTFFGGCQLTLLNVTASPDQSRQVVVTPLRRAQPNTPS